MTDTRDMILDILSDVDPKYITEHLRRNQPSAKRKIVRYAASAAIYAAACVTLMLLLPHIIGKAPDGPPTDGPVDPIVSETDVTATGTYETERMPVTVTVDESEMTEDAVEDKESGVSVYTEKFTDGNGTVTLMYPIFGDGQHDLFDKSMRDYALQKYEEYCQAYLEPGDSFIYEVKQCEIKYESENFISAFITVDLVNTVPATYRWDLLSYTVNADPITGKVYNSEELVGDVEAIKTTMKSGSFSLTYGVEGIMDAIEEGVIESFDRITESWGGVYGVIPDMYFTEDNFGVVVEVNRALGGFAAFEIPYTDASDMMSETAKALVGLEPGVPEIPDVPEPDVPPETEEPVQTTPAPPVTTPAETTTEATTTAPPEPVPEPSGMTHHTDGAVPYSVMRYDSGYISGEMNDFLASDPVFTNAVDFAEFAEKYTAEISSSWMRENTLNDFRYFNDAFFEKYNLYLNLQVEGSGSISTAIDEVSVDNGTLCVNINRYEPSSGTCDMNYILDFIIVENDIANGSTPKYSYDTYTQVYNYYTGELEYVIDGRTPEGYMTYIVNTLPDDLMREPVIMRDYAAAKKFLDSVEKLCGGDTDKYFRGLPSYTAKDFEKCDYVCIGIYDGDYIYNNGKIGVTLTNGILEVRIPVPGESYTDRGHMNLYVMRFSKNLLDEVKEIRLIETESTVPETEYVTCPKCGQECDSEDVWVTSVHPEYKQNGKVMLFVKNSVTKKIFAESPNTVETVREKYISGIEYEELDSSDYTNNPGLVEDIISGKHKYTLPISFTLKDKSAENLTKVLSGFGCINCSDFMLGGAYY